MKRLKTFLAKDGVGWYVFGAAMIAYAVFFVPFMLALVCIFWAILMMKRRSVFWWLPRRDKDPK